MKRGFALNRQRIGVALLLAAILTATWYSLSTKPEGVDVRFLGYAFETPSFELGSFAYGGRTSSARRGSRVACFSITNSCNYPVHCSLSVRYSDGFGSFFPREIALEAHGATNLTGLAGPSAHSRVPTFAEWTNSWRLTVAFRQALPPEGLDAIRYRTALWLFREKFHRLGRFVNPVKVRATETDFIRPDVP